MKTNEKRQKKNHSQSDFVAFKVHFIYYAICRPFRSLSQIKPNQSYECFDNVLNFDLSATFGLATFWSLCHWYLTKFPHKQTNIMCVQTVNRDAPRVRLRSIQLTQKCAADTFCLAIFAQNVYLPRKFDRLDFQYSFRSMKHNIAGIILFHSGRFVIDFDVLWSLAFFCAFAFRPFFLHSSHLPFIKTIQAIRCTVISHRCAHAHNNHRNTEHINLIETIPRPERLQTVILIYSFSVMRWQENSLRFCFFLSLSFSPFVELSTSDYNPIRIYI